MLKEGNEGRRVRRVNGSDPFQSYDKKKKERNVHPSPQAPCPRGRRLHFSIKGLLCERLCVEATLFSLAGQFQGKESSSQCRCVFKLHRRHRQGTWGEEAQSRETNSRLGSSSSSALRLQRGLGVAWHRLISSRCPRLRVCPARKHTTMLGAFPHPASPGQLSLFFRQFLAS